MITQHELLNGLISLLPPPNKSADMEQQLEFLRTVLADEGRLCLVAICDGKPVQKFYDDVGSLAGAAAKFDIKGYDTYFALSTFKASGSRHAKNAKLIKALFLDIDCGEGKPYKNQASGLTALKQFCKQVGLPKPTILVNSGRGIHVYWVLSKVQTREQWLPVAEKLKAACRRHALEVDPVVTADVARILRVPFTHNYKADPALPVDILGRIGKTVALSDISELLGGPEIPSQLRENKRAREVGDRICGVTYADKSFKKLLKLTAAGKGCNQIKRALDKPNDISYGTWTHLLSIVKFCDDTEEKHLHKVSKGYEYYSAEETTKIASSLQYPHTCDRFRDDYEAGCVGCPHNGKIASPITLAMELAKEEEESEVVSIKKGVDVFDLAPDDVEKHSIPEYPWPYFRKSGEGGVYRRDDKEDGEDSVDVRIHPTDLYLTERVRDPISGPCFVIKHHTHRDGVAEFVIPSTSLSSREEMRKAMGENGIHLLPHQIDPLMKYVGAWIEKLQKTVDEHEARTQFGWDKNFTSFAIGDRLVQKDSIVRNQPSAFTHKYFQFFEKLGTLEGYKKSLEFFNEPGMEAQQFMIGTAFASPLMNFVPTTNGGIYNLFSQESGYGKTTAQWVAASTWGVPKQLVMQGESTGNSIWTRAQRMKDISIWIDEFSNRPGKEISGFAYDVAQGQEKSRMTNRGQNEERYKGEVWNMVVGTTANINLSQKVQEFRYTPQGEAQRVMEVQATTKFNTSADVDITLKLNKNIMNNYGHAGPIYAQKLLQDVPAIEKRTLDMVEYLSVKAGATPANRIWVAMGATILVGLQIAKEIELHNWDLATLEEWIIMQIKSLRELQKESAIDIHEVVAEFYMTHIGSCLRINHNQEGNVRPSHLPNQLVQRFEPDIGKLYMITGVFNRWCSERGLVLQTVQELMRSEMSMEKRLFRLAKNTDMDFGPQRCYIVEYSKKRLEELAEKMDHERQVQTDPNFTD